MPSSVSKTLILFLATVIWLSFLTPVHSLQPSSSRHDYAVLNGQHNVTGVQNALVVLVEFQDVRHVKSHDEMKSVALDQLNGYYSEVSYGKMSVSGQVFGWYTVAHTMGYYGHDSKKPGDDDNLDLLANDAVALLPSSIDLTPFRFLVVIHAGQDQAKDNPTSVSDEIWSSCFCAVFPSYQPPSPIRVGSKYFANYAFLSEFNGVGTFAHEWGHIFGLPDLYDAKEEESYVGFWSLMDTGNICCYNSQETTPSYIGAWGSTLLGWLSPAIVDTDSLVSILPLSPLESSNVRAVLIPLSSSTYYFIEYRTQTGRDRSLKNSGVLISFVDETLDTGGGIIKLVDPETNSILPARRNPNDLNGAIFHLGERFSDLRNRVYVLFVMSQGSFNALYSKISLSGLVQTSFKPQPNAINTTYGELVLMNATLVDANGTPVSSQNVDVDILGQGSESWQLAGQGVTDFRGAIHLRIRLRYPVGDYRLRFRYAGELIGETWYNSSLAEMGIRINPAMMKVSLSADSTGDHLSVHVLVDDVHGKPLANIKLNVYVDRILRATVATDTRGTAELLLDYGIGDIGSHTIDVQGNGANYLPAEMSVGVFLGPPGWLVVIIVFAILGAIGFAIWSKSDKLTRSTSGFALRELAPPFLRRKVRQMKVCMYCGRRIPIDARFCTHIDCGKLQD